MLAMLSIVSMTMSSAQQVGQNKTGAGDTATFSVSQQLVVETVLVKDKSGNPVEGLTAKDFTITEDGTAQTIKFFEYQEAGRDRRCPAVAAGGRAKVFRQASAHANCRGSGGCKTQYKDRRLIAMYFDMTAMPVPDQIRALSAAQKFIKTQNDGGGSGSCDAVRGRGCAGSAGFHGRSRTATGYRANDDRRRWRRFR